MDLRESSIWEMSEMTEEILGMYEQPEIGSNLHDVILTLDWYIRKHSGPPAEPSIQHLRENKDAFEKDVLKLIWNIVEANLEIDTVEEGSPWKGKAGLFPTHYGWPDATHLMWQYKHSDWKAEAKKPATE